MLAIFTFVAPDGKTLVINTRNVTPSRALSYALKEASAHNVTEYPVSVHFDRWTQQHIKEASVGLLKGELVEHAVTDFTTLLLGNQQTLASHQASVEESMDSLSTPEMVSNIEAIMTKLYPSFYTANVN